MTKTGQTINGIANLIMFFALVVATIVGIVAVIQQPWLWWQMALAICAMAFGWGLVFSLTAQAHRDS